MTFLRTFVERSIITFLGITTARTLVPDERLNRWLGRTSDADQSLEGNAEKTKDDPQLAAQRKPLQRPE
jgi:hypothetical protein